jgi:hypothetical protein
LLCPPPVVGGLGAQLAVSIGVSLDVAHRFLPVSFRVCR